MYDMEAKMLLKHYLEQGVSKADRALRDPAQPSQNLPDVPFVVVNPEFVSDQASHPRTSSQRRREVVCFRALQQQRHQPFPLRGVQERLAPGASGAAQRSRTLFEVLPPPHTDGLPRNLQPPGRFRLIQPLVEQPHGLETALLQRLKIPLHTFGVAHTC